MTGKPGNEGVPDPLQSVETIADQLCSTVDGDFNVRIAVTDPNPAVQKLALMVNFLLDNVRRSIDAYETQQHELMAAKERAEDADRAKTGFLSVVSHEFRTPLNGVLGGVHLLRNVESPEAKAAADIIDQSGRRLLDMVDDLFLYIQVASQGQAEIITAPTDIGPLASEAAAFAADTLTTREVTLEIQCEEGLLLDLDNRIAARALAGLIENAALASDKGETIRLAARSGDDGAVMEIIDSGCGMDEEMARRAATAFSTASQSSTRSHDGLGLGLPLARGFAELHGGRLEIESRIGEGTAVRLHFPRPADAAAAVA